MKDALRFKIRFPAKAKGATPERAPLPTAPAKALRDAAEYDSAPIEILGVPFGGHLMGRDAYGEAFHPETAIWLRVGDVVNLTYYHGFGTDDSTWDWQNPPVIIGRAVYVRQDEAGHWFEGRLDTAESLAQRVLAALAAGHEVRASSGAVSHLVRYGEAGLIDVWPVGELAVFDTTDTRRPANELAVVNLKLDAEEAESGDAAEADEAKAAPEDEAAEREVVAEPERARRLRLELDLLELDS